MTRRFLSLLPLAMLYLFLIGQSVLLAAPTKKTAPVRLVPVRTIHLRGQNNGIAITPDSRYILADQSSARSHSNRNKKPSAEIDLWDIQTGRIVSRRYARTRFFSAVYSPDGRYLATAYDNGEVCLSDAQGGRTLYRLHLGDVEMDDLYFSPDNMTLAVATYVTGSCATGNGPLLLFDVHTGKARSHSYNGFFRKINDVEFHRSGLWNTDIALDPDMHHFALMGDENLQILTTDGNGPSLDLEQSDGFDTPAISPNGRIVAAITPEDPPTIDSDGQSVIVANGVGQLALWDTATGHRLVDVRHIPDHIWNSVVAFSPNGKYLMITNDDRNEIKIYRVITGS